jgi:hypothetical protein
MINRKLWSKHKPAKWTEMMKIKTEPHEDKIKVTNLGKEFIIRNKVQYNWHYQPSK